MLLTLLAGLLVGAALGLTGGGGSILALPLLVYVLNVPPVAATTISLAAVSLMAMVGAVEATWSRMTEWRTAVILSTGGILSAPLGIRIASHLSEQFILTGFAVLMILVALSMGLRALKTPEAISVLRANFRQLPNLQGPFCQFDDSATLRLSAPCSVALFIAGIATGLLSAIFGVGGGFLIVPALIFVTRMDIHRAVATSLLIIALIGISGVSAALLQGRSIDVQLITLFLAGGLAGMVAGRLLAARIPALGLQKVFAVIVLVIGVLSLVMTG